MAFFDEKGEPTEYTQNCITFCNDYEVERVEYRVELLDEGLRLTGTNIAITLDPGQVVSIRSLVVTEETVA